MLLLLRNNINTEMALTSNDFNTVASDIRERVSATFVADTRNAEVILSQYNYTLNRAYKLTKNNGLNPANLELIKLTKLWFKRWISLELKRSFKNG